MVSIKRIVWCLKIIENTFFPVMKIVLLNTIVLTIFLYQGLPVYGGNNIVWYSILLFHLNYTQDRYRNAQKNLWSCR